MNVMPCHDVTEITLSSFMDDMVANAIHTGNAKANQNKIK